MKYQANQKSMLILSQNKNSYLDIFKMFTNMAKSKNGRKSNQIWMFDEKKYPPLIQTEEKHLSPERSNKNKSNKSDSNKKTMKKEKEKPQNKPKTNFKRISQPITPANEELKRNIELIKPEDTMSETMKKTLEENNKEREINIELDSDSMRFKNTNIKYASAPVSNKNSDNNESIFSNTMKLAAQRASEVK